MGKYNVGALIHKPEGSRESFPIDETVVFPPGDRLKLNKNVTAKVELLKLPHEINVQLKNLKSSAVRVCDKCLRHFDEEINVEFAEREFIIDLPSRNLEVGEDVYYVNKNTNEIELDGMIREEILLHFPDVSVCSSTCKGLCDKCGANLNETTCQCTHDSETKLNPFKFLRP